jgi:hypothetical protein
MASSVYAAITLVRCPLAGVAAVRLVFRNLILLLSSRSLPIPASGTLLPTEELLSGRVDS